MKTFNGTKRKMITLGAMTLLSSAFLFGGLGAMRAQAAVDANKVAALKTAFTQYLSDNSLTLQTSNYDADYAVKVDAFLDAHAQEFEALNIKATNGNGADILTAEGAAAIYEIFGINATELAQKGNTIGATNGDKITGSFKATSASGVSIGDANVNAANGDFSIVVMGDQQTAVEYHSSTVAASYDYIAANKDAMNLKAYINVGDIVDDVNFISWRQPTGNDRTDVVYNPGRMANYDYQLDFAQAQANKLLAEGIPTVMTMGNHDYEDMAENLRVKDGFNAHFPIADYQANAGWGGSLDSDIEASYYTFTGKDANDKYMIITLGTYPTERMLAWANGVVAENPEHKVIVSTHAYMKGGGSRDLRDDGMRMWDRFVSQHENIFMVVCGHETTDAGEVVKRVDYGKHGNAVTQLLIDPQVEEFGGAGIFAQLIFRANGTVDFVYYSPFCNDNYSRGYFMDENQFSFHIAPEKITVNADNQVLVEKEIDSTDCAENYLSVNTAMDGLPLYAYYNVKRSANGLRVDGGDAYGYVVYKLNAGKLNRFNQMNVWAQGVFNSPNGAYQVEFSADGNTYQYAMYNNAETGYFDRTYALGRMVAGMESVFVRISFRDATIAKINLDGDGVQTVKTEKEFLYEYDYANSYDKSHFQSVPMSEYGMVGNYYACLSNNVLGSGGSGRMSYKSNVVYKFDTGAEDRFFTEFSVDANLVSINRDNTAQGYTPTDTDVDYLAKVYVSYDGTFTEQNLVWTENNAAGAEHTEDAYASSWINVPLSEEVFKEGGAGYQKTSLWVKIEYLGWGSSFAGGGLRDLKFAGAYDKELKEKTSEKVVHTYELNGGFYESEKNEKNHTPSREGFRFMGWSLDAEGSKMANPSDYKNEPRVFYAKWKRSLFNITYVLNGGTNAERNPNSLTDTAMLVLGEAQKDGMVFVGWYDDKGNEITKLEGADMKGDIVLYAQYAEQPTKDGGCSGSVTAAGIAVGGVTLLACVLVLLKRKNHGTL